LAYELTTVCSRSGREERGHRAAGPVDSTVFEALRESGEAGGVEIIFSIE
jgi:hypothetical protein